MASWRSLGLPKIIFNSRSFTFETKFSSSKIISFKLISPDSANSSKTPISLFAKSKVISNSISFSKTDIFFKVVVAKVLSFQKSGSADSWRILSNNDFLADKSKMPPQF